MKKFRVYWAVIADYEIEIEAHSLNEALEKARLGEGDEVSISYNETLDGTAWLVEDPDTGETLEVDQ